MLYPALLRAATLLAAVVATATQTPSTPQLIDFANAKRVAFKYATLIHTRFDMGNPKRNPFFYISANVPSWGFDMIKLKVAQKMVDAARDSLAGKNNKPGADGTNAASSSGTGNSSSSTPSIARPGFTQSFFMLFGGTSVTAGHDNWYNQSYPFVTERRLGPVLAALGIDLVVRNIAMGANNCFPYDYCYNAMGGDNPDWLSWEQSFNCGKANGIYEMMARIAWWNKGMVYYMASGGFAPTGCGPSNDSLPWISEEWTPEHDNITALYTPTQAQAQTIRATLHEYYMEGNSVTRFTAPFWPKYNGAAPHGQSVWAKGPKGTPFDYHGVCLDAGGPHWMVAETARYGSGHGAHHHPTWGMHLLRGETIAYWYFHAVIDAIYTVEQDLNAKGAGGDAAAQEKSLAFLSAKYARELSALQQPVPPTQGMHCHPDCDFPPRCFTDFHPHFNPKGRLAAVFARPPLGWVYAGPEDTRTHPRSKKGYGYKDFKTFWEAVKPNASLHLKLDILTNNTFARVCSYDHKEGLRYALLMLDVNVTSVADPDPAAYANYVLSPRAVPWKHRHVGDECHQLENLPHGRHVLSVLVDPNVTVRHRVVLTHVVMF